MRCLLAFCLLYLAACSAAPVGTSPTGADRGSVRTIVAHGGGTVFTASPSGVTLDRAFAEPMRLAGNRSARIVTVASRASDADTSLRDLFIRAGYRNTYHLDVRDPQAIAEIAQADVIYFDGGVQTQLMRKLNAHPAIRSAIAQRYAQGATVAGVSAGAAALSDLMICCDRAGQAVPSRGLGLLSNVVIDQHYTERNRQFRLDQIIADNPSLIGVGIDEGMAVVFRGSSLRIVGSGGSVTLVRSQNGQLERSRWRSGSVEIGQMDDRFAGAAAQPAAQPAPAAPRIINRPIIISANSAVFCRTPSALQQTIASNSMADLRNGVVESLQSGCTLHRDGAGPYGPIEGRTADTIATTRDGQQLFATTTASGAFTYTFVGDR